MICLCTSLKKKKIKKPFFCSHYHIYVPRCICNQNCYISLIPRSGLSVFLRQPLYLNTFFFPFSTIQGHGANNKSVPCVINFLFQLENRSIVLYKLWFLLPKYIFFINTETKIKTRSTFCLHTAFELPLHCPVLAENKTQS